jgi:hypothetical protein
MFYISELPTFNSLTKDKDYKCKPAYDNGYSVTMTLFEWSYGDIKALLEEEDLSSVRALF